MIHTYEQQKMIPNNFVDMNGNNWNMNYINAYNQLTRLVNQSAGIPVQSDSLTQRERDFFLDQRHKSYVQYMDIYAANK